MLELARTKFDSHENIQFRTADACNLPFDDESEIEHSLLSAGFGRVDISSVKHSADIISAADFATGLVFGNPLYEEVTTRGGDPDDIRSAVAASIERELGDSMPLEALVIEAEKA